MWKSAGAAEKADNGGVGSGPTQRRPRHRCTEQEIRLKGRAANTANQGGYLQQASASRQVMGGGGGGGGGVGGGGGSQGSIPSEKSWGGGRGEGGVKLKLSRQQIYTRYA